MARRLVALHSSDPATVYLSAWARLADFEVGDLERELYERRTLIRILGMRRTMFVVPRGFGPTVHCSSTVTLARRQLELLAGMVESSGISERGEPWVQELAGKTLAALQSQGLATASELTAEVPELGAKLEYRRKDGTLAGTFGMSTRILFLLANEGLIIRAEPKGSWTSTMYRWAPMRDWVGMDLEGVDRHEAQADLMRSLLLANGPMTETDLKWWTGWTLKDTRRALKAVDAIEVDTSSGPGYLDETDSGPVSTPGSWVALLPSLDPTVMGWKQREWYLGPHGEALFDRNGNPGPTVWVGGRIVGGWAQRKTGEIVYRLLEQVDPAAVTEIDLRAQRLEAWLGSTVVTPRFRGPLEKELATS